MSTLVSTSPPPTTPFDPGVGIASAVLWGLAPGPVAKLLAEPELESIVVPPNLAALGTALTPGHGYDIVALQVRRASEAQAAEQMVRAAPPRLAVLVVGDAGRLFADSASLDFDVWSEPDISQAASIFVPLLRSAREAEALEAIQAHRRITARLDEVLDLDAELGDSVAAALKVIGQGLDCRSASFWRPSASGAMLVRVASTDPGAAGDRRRPPEVATAGTQMGEVLRSGQPLAPEGEPGSLLIPARANGRTCGVIVLSGAAQPIARRRTSFELAATAADRMGALVQAHLSAQQFGAVTARSQLAIALLDPRGHVVSFNAAAERMLGVPRAEALDAHFESFLTPESRAAQAATVDELIRSAEAGRAKRAEFTIHPLSAPPCEIELSISTWGTGADRRYALIAHDIGDRRRAERQIFELAYTHRASGLPNEPALLAAITEPTGAPRGFIALTVLRFERIREVFGSEESAVVVRAIASRLRELAPANVVVHHLSRVEFMMTVHGVDRPGLQQLAWKLAAGLQQPLPVADASLYLKCATGTSLLASTEAPGVQGIDDALRGLRRAEASESPHPCFYDTADPPDAGRLRREADLHGAVARGELRLHYQPVVELSTGELRGFEALARWDHPKLGLLTPSQFIDLAEETGLIVEIGDWVIEESCRQLGRWQAHDGFAGALSFNLAPRQLLASDLCGHVSRAVARHRVDARALIAEVVESAALTDLGSARHRLGALRELGIRVALDDFGTGESSLGRLTELPVQILKLDRSLIRGLPHERTSRAIVGTTIQLAHDLGLFVVSEGIETPAQHDHLRTLPASFGQGFLFGRPLPAAEASRLL